MQTALLTLRLLLATIFMVASLSKLADREGFRQTLHEFGVATFIAPYLLYFVPVTEFVLAIALTFTTSAWWGAAVALVLLIAFTIVIGINLVQGRRPNCRCFGRLGVAPIGSSTFVRNVIFILIASSIVTQGWADPGPSATDWVTQLPFAQGAAAVGGLAALCILVAQTWFLMALLQQQGRLILSIDGLESKLNSPAAGTALSPTPHSQAPNGLPIGSPAPAFRLSGLHGEALTLPSLLAIGKPVLLAFVDPDCGPCTVLLPELAQWQRKLATSLTIALIGRGNEQVNRRKAGAHGLVQVLLQLDNEVAEAYRVKGTPAAVLIGSDGRIASSVAEGADAIRTLFNRAEDLIRVPLVQPVLPMPKLYSNGSTRRPNCAQERYTGNGDPVISPANIGGPAPAVRLPDLHGNLVDLAEFRGSLTLVLFWHPGCHFCQELLPELKAWENTRAEGPVLPLMISTGTLEENNRLGIRSPVLLAPDFSIGLAFGVTGTPSAVLLDEQNRIASPIAVGGPAVLALAADAAKARSFATA